MFGNIHKAVNKTLRNFNNEAKEDLLHLTNLLITRRRAFLIDNNFVEQAKNVFEIKQDEVIMTASEGIEKFVEKLAAVKGKKIFYVLISNQFQYLQLRNFLLNQGFIEGTDFINGFMFLSERHGLTFNFDSKPIVQEM